jgi:hypothetical protein
MDEKLPLPSQIGLNVEQKNEVPNNSKRLYEIKNNTSVSIENGDNMAVVSNLSIADFPTIDLPASPSIGTTLDIVQGKTNQLLIQGNGKNILINYIKCADATIATFSGVNGLIESGNVYGPNTAISCKIVYNGTEWQNLGTCILVDVTGVEDDEKLTASSNYAMPQEAYTSPILLTFTYTDNIGRLYEGKLYR